MTKQRMAMFKRNDPHNRSFYKKHRDARVFGYEQKNWKFPLCRGNLPTCPNNLTFETVKECSKRCPYGKIAKPEKYRKCLVCGRLGVKNYGEEENDLPLCVKHFKQLKKQKKIVIANSWTDDFGEKNIEWKMI